MDGRQSGTSAGARTAVRLEFAVYSKSALPPRNMRAKRIGPEAHNTTAFESREPLMASPKAFLSPEVAFSTLRSPTSCYVKLMPRRVLLLSLALPAASLECRNIQSQNKRTEHANTQTKSTKQSTAVACILPVCRIQGGRKCQP